MRPLLFISAVHSALSPVRPAFRRLSGRHGASHQSFAHVFFAALSLPLLLSAVSCAVHEWPASAPSEVVLNLDFATEMPQYMVLDAQDTRASRDGRDYELRYTVEAYRKLGDGTWGETPHVRRVFIKSDITDLNAKFRMDMDEGSYRLVVWTDFVEKGTSADLFYGTESFRRIGLIGEHEGNNDFRDAFRGECEVTVRRMGSGHVTEVTVPMERPLAKFEFVTTDLQEFITKTIEAMLRRESETASKGTGGQAADARTSEADMSSDGMAAGGNAGNSSDTADTRGDGDDTKGDKDGGTKGDTKTPIVDLNKYRVVFFYSGYMPNAYNALDDKPCDAATGVRFSSTITAIDSHNARLGFDYVLVNGDASSVMVTVGLYDEEGTQLSMSRQIQVPIMRSMLTVVKGSFLMQNTGGGVSVDPAFEDDYNIVLH